MKRMGRQLRAAGSGKQAAPSRHAFNLAFNFGIARLSRQFRAVIEPRRAVARSPLTHDLVRRLPARSTHPSAPLPRQRAPAAGEVVGRPAVPRGASEPARDPRGAAARRLARDGGQPERPARVHQGDPCGARSRRGSLPHHRPAPRLPLLGRDRRGDADLRRARRRAGRTARGAGAGTQRSAPGRPRGGRSRRGQDGPARPVPGGAAGRRRPLRARPGARAARRRRRLRGHPRPPEPALRRGGG